MATEALDIRHSKTDFPFNGMPTSIPAARRLSVLLRQWRRQRARHHRLAQVLAETSDPRLIEDAGFRPPAPSMLGLWARALLHQHQSHV